MTFTLTPRDRSLVNEAGEVVTPVGQFEVECEAGGQRMTGRQSLAVVEGGGGEPRNAHKTLPA